MSLRSRSRGTTSTPATTRRSGMEGFAEAKMALGRSGLIVMPTDTVYGLAADAFDPTGVRRLLRAKGRGRAMPTPVLIGSRRHVACAGHQADPGDPRARARSSGRVGSP